MVKGRLLLLLVTCTMVTVMSSQMDKAAFGK